MRSITARAIVPNLVSEGTRDLLVAWHFAMADAVEPHHERDTPMDTWWNEVLIALQEEFADIADLEQVTKVTARLLVAALLGGILGFQREQRGKAAGVRTHMLVSIGAALFVMVPQMAGSQADALSRVVQGIVAGVGFLGAGTILKGNRLETHDVKGLTTAAGLWMTAAIGTAVGLGREATAVLSTVLAWGVLSRGPLL
jgi:putative Mg2+ transporter-C (MgtC) family protein